MCEDTEEVSIPDMTPEELHLELGKAIRRWEALDREWHKRWNAVQAVKTAQENRIWTPAAVEEKAAALAQPESGDKIAVQ
jgi:hypothetical protein